MQILNMLGGFCRQKRRRHPNDRLQQHGELVEPKLQAFEQEGGL